MATEVWWVDPPRTWTAGGYLTYKEHDLEVDTVYIHNNRYYSGFQCVKQWFFPLDLISDHYECWSYHFFIKFKVPTLASGTMTDAQLYLMIGGAENVMNVVTSYMDMDIWYKNVYDATEFPWHWLESHDYPTGTWQQNSYSIENMWDLWGDFLVYGPHWIAPVNVTEAVQQAITEGWEWVGILITPNFSTPLDWDYDDRPVGYDQKFYLAFYGAVNPYWVASPDGFPDAYCSPCPWLKITYSGGEPQYVPGEDVTTSGQGSYITCISADPKARMAIAGTSEGGLWYCWSGGGTWDKVYETPSGGITAVWMDIKRNFQDYPNDEIAWFGTEMGELFKSEDSLGTWTKKYTFTKAIKEIMTSETDSNKVVVGIDDGVWVSVDGGLGWTEVIEAPTEL